MQYVLLLIVAAVIGFAIVKQLEKPELPPEPAVSSENAPPAVPTRPQDVEQFDQDINQFVQDAAKEQRKDVDEMTQQ